MKYLVGLTGRAGSGKDTVADILVFGSNFTKLSFASPLKAGLNAMFGWTMANWEDREWKERVIPELGVSPRYLAQTLGTEWGRTMVKENLWPELTMLVAANYPRVVIADVRFDNEAQAILDAGGVVLRVDRNGVAAVNAHSSENPISEELVTGVIYNDGTKLELLTEVDRALYAAFGGKP